MSRVSPSNRIQGRTTTNLVKESGPLPLCPSYRGLASVSPLLPSSTIPFPPPTVFAAVAVHLSIHPLLLGHGDQ